LKATQKRMKGVHTSPPWGVTHIQKRGRETKRIENQGRKQKRAGGGFGKGGSCLAEKREGEHPAHSLEFLASGRRKGC